MSKNVTIKVNRPDGSFIKNWEKAKFVGFSKKINSGLGACQIDLGEKFDYSGNDLNLNNEVKVLISDGNKKDLDGKIPDILDGSLKFSKLYLREEHRIKGFEPELYPEIPEEVLREGIVNAVAHRDWTINASIRLFIFKDRIEIRTPGKLPNTVTVESMKIGGCHILRNPTLYNLLYKIGMVTDTGSGVYRMHKIMKEKLNREIELYSTENEFILSIPRIQKNTGYETG